MTHFEIFSAASEIHDPGERQKYLDEACDDDADLRERVETLLRSSEAVGSFLESPAPALMAVVEAPDQTRAFEPGAPTTVDQLETHVLGDYRILCEIGRGGMGVVYEAEQISLGRHVALKVLPFASMLDKTQLARFKNEARAAASLDHPHVVHVHSVGSERGVHYYAMQLIDGQTVAEVIAAERRRRGLGEELELTSEPPAASGSAPDDPTEAFVSSGPPSASRVEASKDTGTAHSPAGTTRNGTEEKDRIRRVVDLAIQAAEALEHAHQMGIVHRDIKPSNLLVDTEQHLWVADFGLAMIEAEGNITTSGSMLGTLRYMSPEQMRGDRHVLDHHTDIYSLGTTLYEMLTLQPAFPDTDVARLMQRIPNDDPIAPRVLVSSIPRDLDTIVLKAMAKGPDDRYPTADDMAADLQRFLDDEPIHAKPPGTIERTRKWARRHRAVVATAVATLLLAIAVAGGLLWRERSETFAALERETTQRELAEEQEALAAVAQRQSEKSFAAALDAVDRFLARAGDERLEDVPQAQEVRRELIEDAVSFFEKLREDRPGDRAILQRLAKMHTSLSEILRHTLKYEHAARSYRMAIDLLESMLADHEDSDGVLREQLIETRAGYGWCLGGMQQKDAGLDEFERAAEIADELVALRPDDPTFKGLWGQCYLRVARYQQYLGQHTEAQYNIRAAIAALADFDKGDLSSAYTTLALVLKHSDPEQSLEASRKAYQFQAEYVAQDPKRTSRHLLCMRTHALIMELQRRGDHEEALQYCHEGIENARELVQEFPSMSKYHDETLKRLWDDYRNSVQSQLRLLRSEGRRAEASALVDELLAKAESGEGKALAHMLHGDLARDAGESDIARECYSQAIALISDNSAVYRSRGEVYYELREYDLALQDFSKAIEIAPEQAWLRFLRGRAYYRSGEDERALQDFNTVLETAPNPNAWWFVERADVLMRLGQYDLAVEDYTRGSELASDNGAIYKRRAAAYFELQRFDESLADMTRADELKTASGSNVGWISPTKVGKCPDESYREGMLRLADRGVESSGSARAYKARRDLHAAMGNMEDARADSECYVDALTENLQKEPGKAPLWNGRAVGYSELGRYEDAVADYGRAIELQPDEPLYWRNLAAVLKIQGRLDKAVEAYGRVLELDPEDLRSLNALATIHASFGDFAEALSVLKTVIASEEATGNQYYQVALLNLAINDRAGYRDTCTRMLKTFSQAEELREAAFVAWSCVLLADSLTDYSGAIALANRATTKDPKSVFAHRTLGGVLLRSGDAKSALDELQQAKSLGDVDGESPAYTDYLLAMAHHRLGDSTSAHAALEQAKATAELELGDAERPAFWNRRLTLKLLQEEAETLIIESP